MLVLSRHEEDTLYFPSIDATVKLVQIKGKTAKVGVTAPRDVPVLRGELVEECHRRLARLQRLEKEGPVLSHAARNLLNNVTIGLSLLRRQLDAGMPTDARTTLQTVLSSIAEAETAHRQAKNKLEKERAAAHAPQAMVVEDDANERCLLAGFLKTSGFQVIQAGDGAEAIEYLSDHEQPDIVLLDMLMPRMNGPDTVRTIRSNPRHQGLKIYAVSGSSPQKLGLATGPEGVDRWFQKPLDPERLVGEMARAVGVVA
ncbi:MAG: response regulator [Planctomycetes bacterium]|nr:response regulator [Planctomycetota bacterium]